MDKEQKLQLIQKAIDSGVDKEKLKTAFASWDTEKKDRWFAAASQKYTTQADKKPGTIERLARGAVAGISEAGMTAGGLLGATIGAGAFGVGALPGGVAGAALGGAAGEVIEGTLEKFFWPEETIGAEGPFGAVSAAKGAIQGATAELGGPIIAKGLGAGIGAIARRLDDTAAWLSQKAVPWSKKAVKKLGHGKAGNALKESGELLLDQGVTSTPATQRMLFERLEEQADDIGSALGNAYKKADKAAKIKYKSEEVIDRVIKKYEDLLTEQKIDINDADVARLRRILRGQRGLKKDTLTSHQGLHEVTNALEGNMYKASDGERRSLMQKGALAMRKVNEELAEQAGAGEVFEELKGLSRSYRTLATARDAVSDALGKAPSVFSEGIRWAKYLGAQTVGGPALVGAVAATEAAKTTVVKTGLASAANFSSKLLGLIPELGPFGKRLAGIAASKQGHDGVVKAHAHLMMKNTKYRELYLRAVKKLEPVSVPPDQETNSGGN